MGTDLVIFLCLISFLLGGYVFNPRFRTALHQMIRTIWDKDVGD